MLKHPRRQDHAGQTLMVKHISFKKKKKKKTKRINRGSGWTSNSPVERGKITVFVSGVWWP